MDDDGLIVFSLLLTLVLHCHSFRKKILLLRRRDTDDRRFGRSPRRPPRIRISYVQYLALQAYRAGRTVSCKRFLETDQIRSSIPRENPIWRGRGRPRDLTLLRLEPSLHAVVIHLAPKRAYMYADAEADPLVAIIRDAKMAVSSVVANASKARARASLASAALRPKRPQLIGGFGVLGRLDDHRLEAPPCRLLCALGHS